MSAATLKTENEFLSSLVGKVFPVLFETAQDGFAEGYTANYSRIKVQSDEPHTGEILNVKITKAEKDYCLGEFG